MAKIQRYGIKFPISVSREDNTLFDLNYSLVESVKSDLLHVLFTPKGQRLREPEFGTNLIKFIFNPNTTDSWSEIVSEIKTAVERWIPNCSLGEIEVKEMEDGIGVACKINFSVKDLSGAIGNYEMYVKL